MTDWQFNTNSMASHCCMMTLPIIAEPLKKGYKEAFQQYRILSKFCSNFVKKHAMKHQ